MTLRNQRALLHGLYLGVWGGIFWGFLFYRVHQIGHLQILSFQFIPAAMVALLRFWRAPGGRCCSCSRSWRRRWSAGRSAARSSSS